MKEINDSDVKSILKEKGEVLIKFGADWCNPCKVLNPILKEFSEKHSEIKVFSINVDENFELASSYGVRNLPTVLYFNDGKITDRKVGIAKVEDYEKLVLK